MTSKIFKQFIPSKIFIFGIHYREKIVGKTIHWNTKNWHVWFADDTKPWERLIISDMALWLLHDYIWPGQADNVWLRWPGQTRINTFCWWYGAEWRRNFLQDKWMRTHIDTIKDFCDGLEYQIQFKDQCFLDTLEGRWTFSETDAELFKLRKMFKLHKICCTNNIWTINSKCHVLPDTACSIWMRHLVNSHQNHYSIFKYYTILCLQKQNTSKVPITNHT